MLFIKFNIQNQNKYKDFQRLYEHMVMTRQPGFEFEEEEPFDWDNATQEEIDEVMNGNRATPEENRYKELFPAYANTFLESYINHDKEKAGTYGFDSMGIFNYLEFSFEVDMIALQKLKSNLGLVEFEALGFPYGGKERFLMVLKAFGLSPVECYNGYIVYKFNWISDFEHKAIELPKKTELYKAGKDIHKLSFWDKLLKR